MKHLVPLTVAALLLWGAGGAAQELTPRAYWPAPRGTRVGILGYAHAAGDVLLDPSIPLYGVDSEVNVTILAFLETFSLWGRTSNVVVELPYQWGTAEGILVDTPARGSFSGIGDPSVTVSVNLLGAPSMTPRDFQALRAKPRPILGASLKVLVPVGTYDRHRLLNAGANRWAARAELGYMVPLRPKVLLELDAGVWFLGDDPDYIGGYREQDPIFNGQLHLVRRFRAGFWASLDGNYSTGGRQTIGGEEREDLQKNVRLGATLAVPFRARHAVKVGYSTAARTRFGSDSEQFLVTYQFLIQ